MKDDWDSVSSPAEEDAAWDAVSTPTLQESPDSPPRPPSQDASAFFRGRVSASFLIRLGLFIVVIGGLFAAGHFGLFHVGIDGVTFAPATAQTGAFAPANATATAQDVATATAAQQIYTQATSGTPALNDPMHDDRGSWGVFTTNWGGQCAFTARAYHVSLKYAGYVLVCTGADMDTLTNSANFALQIQIGIRQGNMGGFYFGNTQNNSYGVLINSSGIYSLYEWTKSGGFHTFLSAAFNPAIKVGINYANMFTAIVNNGYLYLYAGTQFITSAYLSAYNQGGGGLIVESPNQPTDVEFSNLNIWTL